MITEIKQTKYCYLIIQLNPVIVEPHYFELWEEKKSVVIGIARVQNNWISSKYENND